MAHVIRAYQPTARLPEGEAELTPIYRSMLHNQRALLLMDNAADRRQVEPLIPPESCLMLVTSRQHFTLPGLFTKNLDTLPAEDARKLLLRIAPLISQQADIIAKLCGYLPLALRLAASALAERFSLGVTDYIRRLTDAQQRLKVLDGVEASLSLSYELLSPEMQERWRGLAVLPDTFDTAAAANVWGVEPEMGQDTLSELLKYSLLEWNETTGRLHLHDLVRLFAASRLSENETSAGNWRQASHSLSLLSEAERLYLQGGEALQRGLNFFDTEWPNIRAGQTWAAHHASEENGANLCNEYALAAIYLLDLRLSPRERINWLEAGLQAARLLKNRVAEGTHLTNFGSAYLALGEMHRAIELLEQALLIAREVGNHQGESYALGNLGQAYAYLGEMRRAQEHFEQQLQIARDIGDRYGESFAMANLGDCYKELGETRRAVECFEQALVIDREIGNRRGEGRDLGNLSTAYVALGEAQRALELSEQQLVIAGELRDRRGEAFALGNLGTAYNSLGEARRAIEFYEQALTVAREIGDLRYEGSALLNLSLVFDKLGDRAQAIVHSEDALRIFEKIQHPNTVTVRKQLEEWRGQFS
jgi:tetratricopeptide (TPR) repeat protein